MNGGVLNVAEGGYARFREDVSMTDVTVMSVTDEGSDISSDRWFGGCIHNSVRTNLSTFCVECEKTGSFSLSSSRVHTPGDIPCTLYLIGHLL